MSSNEWFPTADTEPPEGVVVDTRIDDKHGVRNEQRLMRKGNLWFVEDGSMYVYYRPTHYRPSDPKERAKALTARLDRLDRERKLAESELRACSSAIRSLPDPD